MIIGAVLHQVGTPARPLPDGSVTSVERFLAARIAPEVEATALRSRVRGSVLVAGDAGWDRARATFNTLDDQQPALIVTPTDVADVIAVVGFAREHGLRIAPQRTGHNATPLGDLAGTVLRTGELRKITFGTARRIARVEAGGHLGRGGAAARGIRPRCPARFDARRQCGRVRHRWRGRVVRTGLRAGCPQPHRGRPGHRRRPLPSR